MLKKIWMHNFVFKTIKYVVYLSTYLKLQLLKSNVIVNLCSYILRYDQGTVDRGIAEDAVTRLRCG